jgi:endonuclease/exonuclease/phosphatase family metal-dependent hydrolase
VTAAAGVQALSFNLYFGFDALAALDEPAIGFAQLQQTDAAGRIAALARLLAERRPEIVALQEVLRLDLLQDGRSPIVVADFHRTLAEALQAAGAPRYHSFVQPGIRAGGSLELGGTQYGLRFEEANVLLVDPAFEASEAGSIEYSAHAAAGSVAVRCAAQHVRARRAELELELFHTHLEAYDEKIREAQAAELLGFLAAQTAAAPDRPVLLLGDLNATPQSAVYEGLSAAGFVDAFAAAGQGSGSTCCQEADLGNQQSSASMRIDYVFVRTRARNTRDLVAACELVLDQRVPRSDGRGLVWPSDHCGVLAALRLSPE